MRLLKRIADKRIFYMPMFAQHATYLYLASDALCRMTETMDPLEWRRLEKEIKACEVQGDALISELYEQLAESLVPKMRRTDVQTIAMHIDELLDHINDSAKSFHLYGPDRIDAQICDLAQYINAQADAIKKMVSYLDDVKKNHAHIALECERITELEHVADETYEDYIGFIFKNEEDPISVIKYKNIAEYLEAATDAAKRVSDNVRKIIFKYID